MSSTVTYYGLERRIRTIGKAIDRCARLCLPLDKGIADELKLHAFKVHLLGARAQSRRRSTPTRAQARVLSFVKRYMKRRGLPPTRMEIAKGLGFSSSNSAQLHIESLSAKGIIDIDVGAHRGIRLKSKTQRSRGRPLGFD